MEQEFASSLLENAVGNAVLSVPKEFWGSMPQNSYDFHDLQYKYMPLRGRNAEDSVPYGMLEKLQLIVSHNIPCIIIPSPFQNSKKNSLEALALLAFL